MTSMSNDLINQTMHQCFLDTFVQNLQNSKIYFAITSGIENFFGLNRAI
jgi:hypothetical protein